MSVDPFAPLGDEPIVPPVSKAGWLPILPVPDDAPDLTIALVERFTPDGGTFTEGWRYCDAEGRLLGCIARYDRAANGAERKKEFRPFTYCQSPEGKREWRCKGFPEPRPLYGLDRASVPGPMRRSLSWKVRKRSALRTYAFRIMWLYHRQTDRSPPREPTGVRSQGAR